jgi:hypothetical protein
MSQAAALHAATPLGAAGQTALQAPQWLAFVWRSTHAPSHAWRSSEQLPSAFGAVAVPLSFESPASGERCTA